MSAVDKSPSLCVNLGIRHQFPAQTSRLRIPDLGLGVLALTLSSEGHPRGNGDGPLTHPLEQTEQKG